MLLSHFCLCPPRTQARGDPNQAGVLFSTSLTWVMSCPFSQAVNSEAWWLELGWEEGRGESKRVNYEEEKENFN